MPGSKIAQPFGESLVEGAEQKVLDLGLSLFQRPHPRIGVVGLGRELADFGRHAVQSSGVFPDGRRDFSLVGARRVDGREDGSIVGLVRFQSGDPCSSSFSVVTGSSYPADQQAVPPQSAAATYRLRARRGTRPWGYPPASDNSASV